MLERPKIRPRVSWSLVASVVLVLAGAALVLGAVASLAGPSWSALLGGAALVYGGYVLSTRTGR